MFGETTWGRPIDALRKRFPGRWRYDPSRYEWRRSDGAVAHYVADLSIDEDVRPSYRRLDVTIPTKPIASYHTIILV